MKEKIPHLTSLTELHFQRDIHLRIYFPERSRYKKMILQEILLDSMPSHSNFYVFDNHFLFRHIMDDHNHLRILISAYILLLDRTEYLHSSLPSRKSSELFQAMAYFVWTPLRMPNTPKVLYTFRKI